MFGSFLSGDWTISIKPVAVASAAGFLFQAAFDGRVKEATGRLSCHARTSASRQATDRSPIFTGAGNLPSERSL